MNKNKYKAMLSVKSHCLTECLLAFIPLEVTPFFQEGVLYAYWGGAYNEKEGVMFILEDFVSHHCSGFY